MRCALSRKVNSVLVLEQNLGRGTGFENVAIMVNGRVNASSVLALDLRPRQATACSGRSYTEAEPTSGAGDKRRFTSARPAPPPSWPGAAPTYISNPSRRPVVQPRTDRHASRPARTLSSWCERAETAPRGPGRFACATLRTADGCRRRQLAYPGEERRFIRRASWRSGCARARRVLDQQKLSSCDVSIRR